MPNYDWECTECQLTFERIVPRFDTKVVCPKCKEQCSKLISNPTVIIKGPNSPMCDDYDPFDKTMIKKGDPTHADFRDSAINRLRKKGVPDI